jgi:guanylate kinase
LLHTYSAQFGDNLYGTSKATIEEQSAKGKIVVLDIEMEGVKQIKATGFPARYVFIAPPSDEELEKRLRGRGTDKEESILERLAQAKLELDFAKTPGVHDKIIVNNVSCPFATSSSRSGWAQSNGLVGSGEGIQGAGGFRLRPGAIDTSRLSRVL